MENLRGKVLSGLFWSYFQRISVQGVQFVVSMILARILLPSDFGTIALIGVFISLSNLFIDSGFGNALIQKKTVDDKDYSSVFYLNLGISFILYTTLFCLSPLIANFYDEPLLIPVLRIQSFSLLIMAFSCVQTAILTREMRFRKIFLVNIISVGFSSAVGLLMAYNGFGIWSLVFSQLAVQLVTVIGYWYTVGWRPSCFFSWERIKSLFNYSSKILISSVFNVLYNNIYNLIIGKKYNTITLGYYNRGMLIPTLIVDNAANTLNSVMFPALSSLQEDRERMRSIVRKMVKTITYIVFFLMMVLIVLAKPLIVVLLTDKWLPSVPFLQLICITMSFYPLTLINASVLTSLGRSELYLKATVISKVISIILMVICIPFGVYMMVLAGAIGSFISVIITSYWNYVLIGYSVKQQLLDIIPSAFLSVLVGILLYFLYSLDLGNWVILILGSITALFMYILLSFIFKIKAFSFLSKEVQKIIKR